MLASRKTGAIRHPQGMALQPSMEKRPPCLASGSRHHAGPRRKRRRPRLRLPCISFAELAAFPFALTSAAALP
eukprot:5582452-Alexandrium_andersonii.AAC.1